MSTGTNKERLTQNNGIINENNTDLNALKTKINNLPTSGDTTATASDIALGKTAVSKGVKITGTYTPPTVSLQSKDVTINQNGTTTVTADTGYDGLSDVDVTVEGVLDTSDATATASDIAQNKTAYVNGQKVKGNVMTMTYGHTYTHNSSRITDKDDRIYIKWARPMYDILFKDGSYVEIFTAKSDLAREIGATAEKIKKGEVICGVTGTMEEPSPDWSEIGYSETPQDILDDFAYSKSIADNWDSSQTSLYRKYSDNKTLKYFPLVDTSNVTNTAEMFITCTNLVTFPLLNMNNVTRMDSMFSDCTSLRSFPQVNISNVTHTKTCFNNCTSLTNISPLSIPKVENMYFMFNGCSSLTNIELSNMDNVEDMGWAFRQCTNIISVSLNNTLKIQNLNGTFAWCTSLTTIPQLSTEFVTNMSSMVRDCPNLSNESLNNILAMCTNSAVTSNKTLSNIGLSQTQAETCQTLSNWDAFVAAGWSSGYTS